eukprot:TRINITY_DN21078_c0_g1_i1.p1 TRINITY_DN21078_c0_g1~~TRINITY_DN21078_c0_g1_i1.p1  ORF type:complete len:336 (+),score=95.78 TRINITY_DN21078_c0_g1_i1:119-1126(+)
MAEERKAFFANPTDDSNMSNETEMEDEDFQKQLAAALALSVEEEQEQVAQERAKCEKDLQAELSAEPKATDQETMSVGSDIPVESHFTDEEQQILNAIQRARAQEEQRVAQLRQQHIASLQRLSSAMMTAANPPSFPPVSQQFYSTNTQPVPYLQTDIDEDEDFQRALANSLKKPSPDQLLREKQDNEFREAERIEKAKQAKLQEIQQQQQTEQQLCDQFLQELQSRGEGNISTNITENGKDVTHLIVRLPSGKRIEHDFLHTQTIKDVRNWIESVWAKELAAAQKPYTTEIIELVTEIYTGKYSIARDFPRQVYADDQQLQIFKRGDTLKYIHN